MRLGQCQILERIPTLGQCSSDVTKPYVCPMSYTSGSQPLSQIGTVTKSYSVNSIWP